MRAAMAPPMPPSAALPTQAPLPRRARVSPRRGAPVDHASPTKKNASTKVGVFVALVVVMAAGAAAWFTHLIPHP